MRRYLLLPLRPTALLLVGTFTLGLLLALQAGLMGIVLGMTLLSWFFKYCFVVLDAVVAGDEELPVLSIEMVNPVGEQRPLALALLLVAEGALAGALRHYLGPIAAVLTVALELLLLPAQIAVLGITRNAFRALFPPPLLALVRALGRDYALLNVASLGAAAVVYWMQSHSLSLWSVLLTSQMLFLLVFALVGGAVFEHRLELGVATRTVSERIAERTAREHQEERRRMLDRAYAAFRVRKPAEGWQEMEAWLRAQGPGRDPERGPAGSDDKSPADRQLAEYHALLDAASRWEDVRPGDRLANDLITLLLAKRANGEALAVLERRLANHPQFRLSQPAHTVRLAELAGVAGKRSLQRRLAELSR
jgi:hypothetical protein